MPRLSKKTSILRRVENRRQMQILRRTAYRSNEQTRNTLNRFNLRRDPEIRSDERVRDSVQHRLRRRNTIARAAEQNRNNIQHRARRQNPEARSVEQTRNTQEHRLRRENIETRSAEQNRNNIQHRARRQNPEVRSVEQTQNTQEHRLRRENIETRSAEQNRNTTQHRARRRNPAARSVEQSRNTQEHRLRRENMETRSAEQNRNNIQHRTRRQNPEARSVEQHRNTREHRLRRENPEHRLAEQNRNTRNRRRQRENPEHRIIEQAQNTIAHRVMRRRLREDNFDLRRQVQQRVSHHRNVLRNRLAENERRAGRIDLNREEEILDSDNIHNSAVLRGFRNHYLENIKKGPTVVCICCGGLWFSHQVRVLNIDVISQTHPNLESAFYLSEKFPSEDGNYSFCATCRKAVSNKLLPKICLANGLDFPEIPDCLKDLTPLEERLIMPRLPFMTIRPLGYQGQNALKGSVVNIPIPVNDTVTTLPRTFDQTHVIQIHLRRRMEYNHDYMTDTVRPAKIMEALRYLVNTPLYREYNIQVDENWLFGFSDQEEVPFIASLDDAPLIQSSNPSAASLPVQTFIEEHPGGQETLLDNVPVENLDINRLVIAPGEGQRPLDMIQDSNAEELSFATIYAGQKRTCTETYSKIVRSEIRRFDRRACTIPKLFYNYKKLELLQIKNSTSICLRKFSGSNRVTAQNILNENFVQNLIQHDDGYRVLKGVRSSPAHWEAEKKKAVAMIRQFGLPTFFITLSAAESQWPELLVILAKTVDSRDISEDEANHLETQERYRLIRSDAVTCARYFDHRYRQMMKLFKENGGIFNENFVEHFYWRVEFQQRGSPHVHGMYWLKNSPKIDLQDPQSFPNVIDFIDQHVCTEGSTGQLENYLEYQKHNHSRSCTREIRGQQVCRFGIPYPPMPSTHILLPLPDDTENIEIHGANFSKIQNLLNSNLTSTDIINLNDFEAFLRDPRIDMSFDDYLLALRSDLSKPKVFLKRKLQDRSINAYNPLILELHRANMDIQFILDAYACCSYIINYINKSSRGISRLLNEAISEVNAGNYTVKQKLQHIGHKFISGTEISAQEAVYCCIGLHLSEASNADIFINTSRPEERVRMVKPRAQLENISAQSTDIFVAGLLEHYTERPNQLENVCLADFAAMYSFVKSVRGEQTNAVNEEDIEDDSSHVHGVAIPLRDGSGFLKKRTKPCIIRSRRFSPDTAKSDYLRETIMLYHPWRDEQTEIIDVDHEQVCIENQFSIEENRKKYDVFEQRELETVLDRLRDEVDAVEPEVNAHPVVDNEFRVLAFPEVDPDLNLLDLNGGDSASNGDSDGSIRLIKLPPLIPVQELLSSIRTLNTRQRIYLTHVLHSFKKKESFFEFVGGGAGVGKSRLISSIYQSLNYRMNLVPGSNPSSLKVLLCAPTGKAAFGIGGATLHSIFSLPVNQSNRELRPLSNDVVNSIYTKLSDLKIIIIDEISMVGARMFGYVDARLKQIFKNSLPFGGISLIVFGDLKQLSPVGDRWIFSPNPSDPYSALIGSPLWDPFKYFELTEIMRQRGDQPFAVALNNMASGSMTREDISLIEGRVVNENQVPDEAIHLFWSNEETDRYNALKLSQIPTASFSSIARDVVKGIAVGGQRANILERVRLFKTSETQGLPHSLTLKTTAKYMITVNINTGDGLVNGATGQLMEVGLESSILSTLWMKFLDPSVGLLARSKKPHPHESSWTPIEKTVRAFQYKRNEQITIERNQFPIVPAEGITIHKSQGATYNQIAVHTRLRMPRASLYVACSRATSAEGLFILGSFLPPNPLSDSDPVFRELAALNTTKALIPTFNFMHSRTSDIQIIFQNIQSLHAHVSDVSNDHLILSSDILCFAETWSYPSENFEIPGFTALNDLRIDSTETRSRNKRGLLVYAKTASMIELCKLKKIYTGQKVLEVLLFKNDDLYVLMLYRNSSFPLRELGAELQEILNTDLCNEKVLIIGDFNLCLKTSRSLIENILREKGFSSLLGSEYSTTPIGTQIDWAFSNMGPANVTGTTYETIHSYHDSICVSIFN